MAFQIRGIRASAAGFHLLASALVGVLIAFIVFGLWYPGDYGRMSGGASLFRLLVGVDICLGPVVTLIIFDPRKSRRELVLDMVVVVALQIGATAYGLYAVVSGRPVVLALEQDRFRLVTANQVLESELGRPPGELKSLPWTGPALVRSAMARGADRAESVFMALGGHDVGTRPSYWRRWDPAATAEVRRNAKPLSTLSAPSPTDKAQLEAAIAATHRPVDRLRYLPVLTRRGDWIALVDAVSGEVVGFAPVNGF